MEQVTGQVRPRQGQDPTMEHPGSAQSGGPPATYREEGRPAPAAETGLRGVPTRWGPADVRTFIPGTPTVLHPALTDDLVDVLLLRMRVEELTQKICTNTTDVNDPTVPRSPSPPMQYDKHGARVNTREQRAMRKIIMERQRLLGKAKNIHPYMVMPADFKQQTVKMRRKMYIPVKEYPDYNFVGLVIGPRGLTQKQMERETGAKIAVRGKGNTMNGRIQAMSDDDDALHVLITADTRESLEAASVLVRKLLTPIDETQNEHKRAQLRKLAEINGTLRDTVWNHREDDTLWSNSRSRKCGNCGETSHPSYDCPLQGSGVKETIEREFAAFLREIGDQDASVVAATHDAALEELMGQLDAEPTTVTMEDG